MNIAFMSCLDCTDLVLSVAHGPIGLLQTKFLILICRVKDEIPWERPAETLEMLKKKKR